MNEQEQQFAKEHLQESERMFLETIRGLGTDRWHAKLDDQSWSVAGCAEHIVILEGLVGGRFQAFGSLPDEPYDASKSKAVDERVLLISQRLTRVKSPDFAVPQGKYLDPEAAIADFRIARKALTDAAFAQPDWLRGRFRNHPFLGKLDGYQWLITISSHTKRHTAQIAEILEKSYLATEKASARAGEPR